MIRYLRGTPSVFPRGIGFEVRNAISRSKQDGGIAVDFDLNGKHFALSIEMRKSKFSAHVRPSVKQLRESIRSQTRRRLLKSAVQYIPASRAGMLQTIYPLMYLKNTWIRDLGELAALSGQRYLRPTASQLPLLLPHLEDFYELFLRYLGQGNISPVNEALGKIIGGQVQIESQARGGTPVLTYTDPTGYSTSIEKAGSGVIEVFPLLLFLERLEKGGLLFIEEPEAHVEVRPQNTLVRHLVQKCKQDGISTVVTTHSDWIIFSFLQLVREGVISKEELALYYFDRHLGDFTHVTLVEPTKGGLVERLTPFDEALEKMQSADLASAFS